VPIGQQLNVDWASFVRRVRWQLAGGAANARNTKQWLLPMLYARSDPFIIKRGNANLPEKEVERLKAELAVLKKQRDEAMQLPLPPEIKLAMKAEFDARIQQIEVQIV
jgi:hypothetical protein